MTKESFSLVRACVGAGVGAAVGFFATATGESPLWWLAVPVGLLLGFPPRENSSSGDGSGGSSGGDGGSDSSSSSGGDSGGGGGGDGG